VQGSKQMGHSNASSRNFLRDASTEDNVNSMTRIEMLVIGNMSLFSLCKLKMYGCM
jgi:hypothetical protein